jgi:hypothetical protein
MDKNSNKVQTFDAVEKGEWKRIHQRRELASNEPAGDPSQRPRKLTGLGLSGGGIRSAIFNLGLLQAMEKYDYLRQVDYLSTVSGGGYIGSTLTWFCSRLGSSLPFVWKKPGGDEAAPSDERARVRKVLDWLRVHGSYLTPGNGLNLYSLLAAVLAGSLVTLSVLVPVFLMLAYVLHLDFGGSTGFEWSLCIGEAGLAAFGLFVFLHAISTAISVLRRFTMQRRFREWMGRLLVYSAVLLIVGSLPLSHDFISDHWKEWVSGISLGGIVAMAGALIGGKKGAEVKGMRSVLLSVGLLVLVYGVFLGLYHLVGQMDHPSRALYWALAFSVVLAVFANINHVSMHRYYRNRLMEAFMQVQDEAGCDTSCSDPDRCKLGDIPQTAYPYHLINTNLQTVGSEVPRLQQRGAESFILSPGWCGSEATGYVPTRDYVGNTLNLATAMAISGAAADTNTYATKSRPINFIMALLNLRLGYWIRNPRHPAKYLTSLSRPRWYIYLFREILGRGLSEKYKHIHLSDGGHFENLGLYELVRRRCDYIIISDAGADPDFHFGDIGHAMELVRTDFGANIDIDIEIEKIRPDSSGYSPQAFVPGKITYENGDAGILLYIKTACIRGLPADVRSYRDDHPLFPDESTADQFFDEAQFEAYRELGYRIGKSLFGESANSQSLDKLIVSLTGKEQ